MSVLCGFAGLYGSVWRYEKRPPPDDTKFHLDLSPYSGKVPLPHSFPLRFFPMFRLLFCAWRHIKKSPLQKLIIANGLWFLNKQYKNYLRQTFYCSSPIRSKIRSHNWTVASSSVPSFTNKNRIVSLSTTSKRMEFSSGHFAMIIPPCFSATALARERPIPVPPVLVY